MYLKPCHLVLALVLPLAAQAGSLKVVKHIVLFMQENRAFDHVSRRSFELSLGHYSTMVHL